MTPPLPPSTQIILDLSRLVHAGWSRTPKGIPRVELAYAEHFMAVHPRLLRFAVLDALGRLRVVDNKSAIAFIREISGYWEGDVASTASYLRILLRTLWIHIVLVLRPWGGLKQLVAAHRERSLYVIPSQLHLEHSSLIEEVKSAGDVKLVYFVHDILSTVFPAYFPDGQSERDRRRMENAVRLANTIIVSSQVTADAFQNRFGSVLAPRTLVVAPLGVTSPVRVAPTSPAPPPEPYFVMLGTIEPRKNHKLILDLWSALYSERRTAAPRLFVVGERGWKNRGVIQMLERCAPPHGLVEECGRLPDEAVTGLLKQARALLVPSLAEGYGLPLAEALTQGTPVLCSDIPVFREVGKDIPDYLDPGDGSAWRAAVLDYAELRSPAREAQLRRLRSWSRPTWKQHFTLVDAVLRALAQ